MSEDPVEYGSGNKTRKTRSDKGTKRDMAYMVTTEVPLPDIDEQAGQRLLVVGRGKTADEACAGAASKASPGQTVEVWRRVGKPRTAQLRLL